LSDNDQEWWWALRNKNPYAVTPGDMEPIDRWQHLTEEDLKLLRGLKIETRQMDK